MVTPCQKDISERETVPSAQRLAGQGLMGVADRQPTAATASVYSWQAGFALVELDIETGVVDILEYLGWADCGVPSSIPGSLHAQELGGSIQGIGHGDDPALGLRSSATECHLRTDSTRRVLRASTTSRVRMRAGAVGIPDPQTPIGAKGNRRAFGGCREQLR